MKIDSNWLIEQGACSSGKKWFVYQAERDGEKVVKKLVKEDRLDWANWLVVRLMTHEQRIRYAIYAAEQVIELYEKQYPNDKRPREAIEAAKAYLKDPSDEKKDAARAAAWAAWAAAEEAGAEWAAWAGAAEAAWVTEAAVGEGAALAAWAAGVTEVAENKLKKRTIENGLKILEQEVKR